MKDRSLRRRLLVRLALIIGFFWLATSAVAAYIVYDEISEVLDSSLEETAHRIAPLAKSLRVGDDDGDAVLKADSEKYEHEEYVSYQIQTFNGRLVFRSHEAPQTAWPIGLHDGFSITGNWRLYEVRLTDSKLVIQVGEKLDHRLTAVSEATLVMTAPVLIVLPILLLLFRHILNTSFKPIVAFGREIAERGSANLSDVEAKDLPDEFDPIRNRLNELLARVRATLSAERSFSSNSAHQLRTPVAAALAQSEMLARELQSEPQKDRVNKLSQSLRRLSRIVEKLLQLARADADRPMPQTVTDATEIITVLLHDYRRLYPERRFVIDGFDEPHRVMADADALAIMVQNLVENACAYAPEKAEIEIRFTADHRLIVSNDCEPIAPDLLGQLGERFVRGTQDLNGSGLGLAIITSLARQSDMRVSIYSPKRGEARGFEVEIALQSA